MSICSECAMQGKTCCQENDILVTDGDILRITNSGLCSFFELRSSDNMNYTFDEDPNWKNYILNKDKKLQLLKKKDNGDCIMLGSHGCVLSIDTRPLICRIYPFYYNEEKILELYPYKCPCGKLQSDDQWLLANMGVNAQNAEKWRYQLYDELRKGEIFNENRSHIRSTGLLY